MSVMSTKTAAPKVPVALPKKEDTTTSPANGASTLSQDDALKIAIGSKIRLATTTTSTPLEGYLHTADPIFNWLILWFPTASTPSNTIPTPSSPLPPSGSAKIIPISTIQSFTILSLPPSPSTSDHASTTTTLNPALAQSRLQKAISSEQSSLLRRGPKGTSPSEQSLFEALARTMPARWEGSKMVISDQYVIEKPYQAQNVGLVDEKAGTGRSGLERVKRIVDMERSKINLRGGGDVVGKAGKKGG